MVLRSSCVLTLCLVLTAVQVGVAQNKKKPREFAEGVVKTIEPDANRRDSYTHPARLAGTSSKKAYTLFHGPQKNTLFVQTKDVTFFKNVWHLEFQHIGLRQMQARVPTGKGFIRQNVWYLVYRVRNVGANISYKTQKDRYGYVEYIGQENVEPEKESPLANRFFPKFVLQGQIQQADGSYKYVSYRSVIMPSVIDEIQRFEDPNRELLDTVEISRSKLPVEKSKNGGGVWGVAVFTGVNPKIDYVSVQVGGLTNAFRVFKTDKGPVLRHKVLQLNFWRPGDDNPKDEAQDPVRYGIPLVESFKEQVRITKYYNLPGPQFRVYELGDQKDRSVFVCLANAATNPDDFSATEIPKLNSGAMIDSLVKSLADAGVKIAANTPVTKKVDNSIWQFQANVDGKPKTFEIRFEPQYWEKYGKGIRFIKSLDYLWLYR